MWSQRGAAIHGPRIPDHDRSGGIIPECGSPSPQRPSRGRVVHDVLDMAGELASRPDAEVGEFALLENVLAEGMPAGDLS